jgi:hypothetical protein
LTKKYNEPINRESAFEILEEKINNAAPEKEEMEAPSKSQRKASAAKDVGFFESLSKNTMVRQLGRTFFRELTRGIMGSLTNKKR